jgi:aspartate carbamoyltransferase catalytic subunit
MGSYADILVVRHPLEGSARLATQVTETPVINAGDGANQHPTQTLADLYAIQKSQENIENLHIILAGDLKFGRTVHSLSLALAHYGARLYFVSPEVLTLPDSIQHQLRKKGIKFSFHRSLREVLFKADVLYMTRIQTERFEANALFSHPYLLKKEDLKNTKPNLKIFHPLPRNDEIEKSIDDTSFARYFKQASDAIFVRMAILALLLRKL